MHGIYNKKEVKNIIPITKNEAFAMRKILGNESVKKSHSRNPKYYIVESKNNLQTLYQFQKSKIVK